MRNLRMLLFGLCVFDTPGECFVERGFLAGEAQLLVSASLRSLSSSRI